MVNHLPMIGVWLQRPDDSDLVEAIEEAQELLQELGYYTGRVDGWFGEKTRRATQKFQQDLGLAVDGIVGPNTWGALYEHTGLAGCGELVWGTKVSPAFRSRVRRMEGLNPDYLMAVMAFETGREFTPTVRNKAGSGAIGLIQFMPSTAAGLLGLNPNLSGDRHKAVHRFAEMSDLEQLDYVEKYMAPYKHRAKTLEDTYMAVLYPRAIGRSNDYVLFRTPSIAYRQNRGLDQTGDGTVTKAEAAAPVRREYRQGSQNRA